MDVFSFINSKDIREYLKNIDYKFRSLEAAWLIYQCKSLSVKEKHNAWNDLINSMPDCEVPERYYSVPHKSLHAFLKKYIEIEDRLISRFLDSNSKKSAEPDGFNTSCVYQFLYYYDDGHFYNSQIICSQFENIYENLMEPEENVVKIICKKMQIDNPEILSTITLDPEFEIMSVDPIRPCNKDESDVFFDTFDAMWFDFPVPFKKGDILWDPHTFIRSIAEPFVLEGSIFEESAKKLNKERGDCIDMLADGYYVDPRYGLINDCLSSYMNLEYYSEELTGEHKALVPLSSFLKGKIGVGLFATAYHQIMTEYYSKKCIPRDIDDKLSVFFGI